MADLIDRDQEHLRLLAWGYYVFAGMTAFGALFSIFFLVMGSLILSGTFPDSSGQAHFVGALFIGIGFAMFAVLLGSALLLYFTGRNLRRRRRRTFCLITAALLCLQFPWGTLIGILTFIVLDRPGVRAQFDSAPGA